jgi:hypothetical protein
MTVTLHLPPELESKLAAEATRQGLPLADYMLRVLSNGGQTESSIHTGAELVDYWQKSGVVGARSDIRDSQQYARDLRAIAERRERS